MTSNGHDDVFTCAVCGEQVAAEMSAVCNWCDSRYHLNQRNDVEAKDCGEVWIDEQYLALQFACNVCLGKSQPQPRRSASRGASRNRPRRYKRRA